MLVAFTATSRARASREDRRDRAPRSWRLQELVAESDAAAATLKSLRDDAGRRVVELMRAARECAQRSRRSGCARAAAIRTAAAATRAAGAGIAGRRPRSGTPGFSAGLAAALRSAARKASMAGPRQDDRALSGDPHQRRSYRGATERRRSRSAAREGARAVFRPRGLRRLAARHGNAAHHRARRQLPHALRPCRSPVQIWSAIRWCPGT